MLTKGPNSKAIKRILSTHRTGYRSALDWAPHDDDPCSSTSLRTALLWSSSSSSCAALMKCISFHSTHSFLYSVFFFLWKKWMLKEIFEQQRKLTPPPLLLSPLFLSLSLWCALPNSRCTLLIHFSNFHISQITNGPARSSQRQC